MFPALCIFLMLKVLLLVFNSVLHFLVYQMPLLKLSTISMFIPRINSNDNFFGIGKFGVIRLCDSQNRIKVNKMPIPVQRINSWTLIIPKHPGALSSDVPKRFDKIECGSPFIVSCLWHSTTTYLFTSPSFLFHWLMGYKIFHGHKRMKWLTMRFPWKYCYQNADHSCG